MEYFIEFITEFPIELELGNLLRINLVEALAEFTSEFIPSSNSVS